MEFELHDREKSVEADEILENLKDYNERFTVKSDLRHLTITFKNQQGRVVAGLTGNSNWGWLFVRLLWVSDDFRGKGFGRKLMQAAETEAKRRVCRAVYLDTFSFQARDFYERLGYKVFGTLDDFPAGHQRYYLYKKLD